MSTRKEINGLVLDACRAVLPEVNWTLRLVGAEKGKGPQGSVSCDRIDLINKTKELTHAIGKYEIYIIDFIGDYDVDAAADTLVDVFNKTNMGGFCVFCEVKNIVYGSVQGSRDSNVCLINIEVEYEYDVKGE